MAQEIKKGNQQFYVGEDEQNAQAVITFIFKLFSRA
jgi:hypothetical protein